MLFIFMNKKLKILIYFLTSLVFLFAIYNIIDDNGDKKVNDDEVVLLVGDKEFKVEVVDTQEKRVKGLSEREYLPIDTVLLFVFDREEKHGIWMKDMNFAIDIIWLDKDYYVVDYMEDVLPETFPDAFYPKEVARYVVEVNGGFIRTHVVEVGDKLNFY